MTPDIDPESSRYPLIGPGDPPPCSVLNPRGAARALLLCDHASRRFPHAMGQLGLADWVLERHVAWDIGSEALTRHLVELLDAPAVVSAYSRLIVDPNRNPNDPTAFIQVSDGIAIPGNLELGEEEKQARAQSFFWPYHDTITAEIERFRSRGITPAVIAIHTCTPVFDRIVRPWHVGVLWDQDARIARPLMDKLQAHDGVCVGDNEPYSGRHPHDFTIDYHAEPAGLPHVGIEVRQDLLQSDAGVREWGDRLGNALREILADETLYSAFRADANG